MKKHIIGLMLFATLATVAAAQSSKSITLAWNFSPGDSITNYYFNVRTSSSATTPLPWPIMISVTNALTASFTMSLTQGASQYFYVTANDLRSSPTLYAIESDPSNTVSTRLLPSGGLSIGKGP